MKLNHVDNRYVYNDYEIEYMYGRWYVFDGPHCLGDFKTLAQARLWISDVELISDYLD